jgi:Zn-dependent M28 family amino/carboxypeptidase
VVLVMAHHDAFYQGADDNSSGVAVLLEVARVAAGHEFDRTIRFVSVDLEERGAVGSTRYVEAGLADDAVAAIVLESVGFTCATRGCQDAPAGMEFGEVGDYLMIAGNEGSSSTAQRLVALANGEDLVRALGVLVPGDGAWLFTSAFLRSDNGPLWLRGVPAVMFTDTANFRNPNYHLASDTPDTLDPAFLAGVARATAAAVALLAGVRP